MRVFPKLMLWPPKEKKKHDGMKHHLRPKKEYNKFKNSGGSKGPKSGYFVCGKPRDYARDSRYNKLTNEINIVHENDT